MAYNTVSDYILNAQTTLQQLANSNSIQLSSVGSLGYLLNLLANTQYNHKLYHDAKMLNTNLLTATEDKNLIFLGSLQGYKRKFATPSLLNGTINFGSFILTSQLPSNVESRIITIKNPDAVAYGINYQSNNIYTIAITKSGNINLLYSIDILSNGKLSSYDFDNTGLSTSASQIPILNTLQYDTISYVINIPYYGINSSYTKTIQLDGKHLYTYSILINSIPFSLVSDKISTNGSSNVIFYSYDTNGDLILEFGDNVFAKYVSNLTMQITLNLTIGSNGNIGSIYTDLLSCDSVVIKDYNVNGIPTATYTKQISELITYNITNATNGTNILTNDDLRKDIIKFIQSNSYLISYQDYKNLIKSKYSICEFLFKKTNLLTNEVFFYFPIYNGLLNPINTICKSIEESVFNPDNLKLIINPTTSINARNFISPFSYIYDSFNRKYLACLFDNDILISSINKEKYSDSVTYLCPNFNLRLLYDKDNNITVFYIESSTQYNINNYDIYMTSLPNQTYDHFDISGNVDGQRSISFNNIYATLTYLSDKYVTTSATTYELPVGYLNYQFTPTEVSPTFSSLSTVFGDNSTDVKGVYYKIPDFIQNLTNIKIKIKKKTSLRPYDYLMTFDSISQINILGTQFELKKIIYPNENTEHVFGIPYMESSDYTSSPTNKKYIDSTLLSNINYFNSVVPTNKSPVDDVQYRLLNSTIITQNVSNLIFRQLYNFDIVLPLRLNIALIINNDYVVNNNIDVNAYLSLISSSVGTFLKNKVGTVLSLYPSDIINILADYKFIKSVTAHILDSDTTVTTNTINGVPVVGNLLDSGVDTFSITDCEANLLKTSNINRNFIDFTPILYYFDYTSITPANITVNYY